MSAHGKIAESAQGELPLTWKALSGSADYGDSYLGSRITVVSIRLFGRTFTATEQASLDPLVVNYAGKLIALELINPAIDFWGKQPLSVGATGRNENKGYKDRTQDLVRLRAYLLEQTRLIFPEVEALLPGRRNKRPSSTPRVKEVAIAHTPNPYDFERPFVDLRETL